MAITFEVPNLDCESADDLEQLGIVLSDLARYASHKAVAMQCREVGRIAPAQHAEMLADKVYKRLPEWARW